MLKRRTGSSFLTSGFGPSATHVLAGLSSIACVCLRFEAGIYASRQRTPHSFSLLSVSSAVNVLSDLPAR